MTSQTQSRGTVRFAAVGLDHSHAFDQVDGLLGEGCELVGLSSDEPDSAIAQSSRQRWPHAPWVDDSARLLHDPSIDLVVTAAVPDRRASITIEALTNGKDVVADKPGCVSLQELDQIKKAVDASGRIWSVSHLLRAVQGALCDQGRPARPR